MQKPLFLVILLTLLIAATYYPVFLSGKVTIPTDILESQYPWAAQNKKPILPDKVIEADSIRIFLPWQKFLHDSVTQGQFPFWNPYSFSGAPFLANGQSAVFDPLNLILFRFPLPIAFTIIQILQTILLGIFSFLFLKRLRIGDAGSFLGALVFSLNPLYRMVGSLHIWLGSMMYIPLAFLFTDLLLENPKRKFYGFALSLTIALQILGGLPEFSFYTLIFIFCYSVFKKERTASLTKVFIYCACGLLLAAPQIFPTMELAGLSNRAKLFFAGPVRAFPPWHLITAIVPQFFGVDLLHHYSIAGALDGAFTKKLLHIFSYNPTHTHIFYFSILGLLLLIYALIRFFRKESTLDVGFFVFGFFFSLLWSMSARFYSLFFYFIPIFNRIETPERMIFLSQFFVAVIIAFGTHEFLDSNKRSKFLPVLFICICFVDLFIVLRSVSSFGNAELVTSTSPGIQWLKSNTNNNSRMAALSNPSLSVFNKPGYPGFSSVLEMNSSVLFGFRDFRGFDSLYPKWTHDYGRATNKQPFDDPGQTLGASANSRRHLLDLASVRYFLLDPRDKTWMPGTREVYRGEDLKIFENKMALPRAYLVTNIVRSDIREDVFTKLLSEPFEINNSAILTIDKKSPELKCSLPSSNQSMRSKVTLVDSQNEVRITTDTNRDGILVLTDTFFPGWQAFIDRKLTPIGRANWAFRAICLPSGHHEIIFRFWPQSFTLGLVAAILGLVWLAISLFYKRELHR